MPDTAVAPPAPLPRPGVGSGIGQLLRDPDHYEEINVIGNGETPLLSYNYTASNSFTYKNPEQIMLNNRDRQRLLFEMKTNRSLSSRKQEERQRLRHFDRSEEQERQHGVSPGW